MLLVLCTAMFLGAFASGYIPLAFGFSEAKLRLITIFGAGLLVGTALIVIIPEGVSMHYEGQQRHAVGAAAVDAHAGHAHGAEEGAEHHSGEGGDDITHAHPGHWQIGASLALGFAFQLIVGALLHAGGAGVGRSWLVGFRGHASPLLSPQTASVAACMATATVLCLRLRQHRPQASVTQLR